MHSYIYFIHSPSVERVKVGRSKDVYRRFLQLQTGSADALRLLGYVDGGAEIEALLHREWCEHRLKGEWFSDAILPLVSEVIETFPRTIQPPIPTEYVAMRQRNDLVSAWNRAWPSAREMFLSAIGASLDGDKQ